MFIQVKYQNIHILNKAINQNTREHVRNLKNITEEDKCPRCQIGHLIKRKGQYGEFWGCSQYPKCKYTRK
ncbi:TPA: topoisomerase DNA-binding C4 zinc finger domain-containing protein [Clostridioides difficile]|nr:topoisomerase DNA-binding C4 zinc finger domain-containing protein [Clostridioides difficile]HCQ5967595.1 topoisomerase DNA-binding C4 zinc finger domain-containing protein [Clostridioides difficile]